MIKLNQICYRTINMYNPWAITTYQSIGGYCVWKKILKNKISKHDIIEEIKKSCLLGRGGAGFSTGLKWSFIKNNDNEQKYIICNADEGEPGTCKDRDILYYNPHQLIEGIAIAGYAIGATVGYNYIRGEFWLQFKRMENALQEAYSLGLLGHNILNSNFTFNLYNHLGSGSYICGEETALLNSIEGKKGQPRFKPPFPAHCGLYGKPTVINNVETLASIPVILEKGFEWFLKLGNNGGFGTKCFSVTGHINKPGNYEIPLGTPFKDLLQLAGGIRKNRKIKAVIPGGISMKVIPGNIMMKLNMDFNSLKQAGSGLGSGAVIIMDENTCMVEVLYNISMFYMEESCGKCTPCREGTGWMARIIKRIKHGKGEHGDIEKLVNISKSIEGRTICAFGEASSWPVQSFIKHFYNEFNFFIKNKRSFYNKV